jgi:hypothetical protein
MIVSVTGSTMNSPIGARNLIQVSKDLNRHCSLTTEGAGVISDLDLQQQRECPFCFEVNPTWEMAARHIANHLIRIALFALPRSTGIEVEQDDQSTISNENATRGESIGSDELSLAPLGSSSSNSEPVKDILHPPCVEFRENPSLPREGVAPLKDAGKRKSPREALWTQIDRSLVDPEALGSAVARIERWPDHVILLWVASEKQIEAYTWKTQKIGAEQGIPCDPTNHLIHDNPDYLNEPDETDTKPQNVNTRGYKYLYRDESEEVEAAFLRQLAEYEKEFGPDARRTLDLVHNLGRLYLGHGNREKAKEMYMRALKGFGETSGYANLRTHQVRRDLYALQRAEREAREPELRDRQERIWYRYMP